MGRPINKRLIGDPAQTGVQITASVNVGTGVEAGLILSQRSNRRYRVLAQSSSVEGICTLVNSATPGPGEMSVTVLPDGALPGAEEYAFNINNRTVRTFQGNVYAWPENPSILGRVFAEVQNQEV